MKNIRNLSIYSFSFYSNQVLRKLSMTVAEGVKLPSTFAIAFLILFSTAKAQPPGKDCSSLHTGTFYYYSPKSLTYYIFTRNDSMQVEIDRLRKDTSFWRITWKGCDYKLHFLRSTKTDYKTANVSFPVHILEKREDYYIYEAIFGEKKNTTTVKDTLWLRDVPEKFLERKITNASFPGGDKAWQAYISQALQIRMGKYSTARKGGTCYIEFTIDTNGYPTGIKALNMEHSEIASFAIHAIQRSPRWTPASIDGVPLPESRVQPITLEVKMEEINPPEY